MAKRRAVLLLDYPEDFGPGFTRDRSGRPVAAPIGAGQGVEIADIPDLDRPDKRVTVRVARRIDPLMALLDPRRDGPGRHQFLAAERFRRDSAIADGASGCTDDLGTYISGGYSGIGPTGAQIDAQTRMVAAWKAIRGRANEADVANVIRFIVLGYATLDAARAAMVRRREAVREMLNEGLDRLVNHYDGEGS